MWTGSAVAAVIQVCVLGLLSIQHVNDKQDSNAADGVFLCSGCLATLVVRLYINLTPTARLNFLFSSPIDSIIHSFISQSDEEPVDRIKEVRQECYKTCPKQQKLYDACVQRITEKKEGDCESWFLDLLTCADKCVAPKIFKLTKE